MADLPNGVGDVADHFDLRELHAIYFGGAAQASFATSIEEFQPGIVAVVAAFRVG